MLSTHPNRLSPSFRRFQEFAQLLPEDLQPLRARGVGHAEHRAPEVEGVGDVGAGGEEDEEDEVDWVSEH